MAHVRADASGEPSVVVLGATASGKSDVAMAAARASSTPVHIVAADAMQVYRGMDIGTAKPTADDRCLVPHHCLDTADAWERHTVSMWHDSLATARHEIAAAGARAILVGGTGLYVTAAVDGLDLPGEWPQVRAEIESDHDTASLHRRLTELDPEAAARMEPSNRRRIVRALEVCIGSGQPFSSFGSGVAAFPPTDTVLIGIRWDRDALRRRIAVRVDSMLERGLVDEVRRLVESPQGLSATARQALGYKEIIEHLEGRCTVAEAIDAVVVRTGQFAVRQERWYRRDPRIRWIDVTGDPVDEIAPVVSAALA
ncbi:MAG: tRNA (adenosine(37)-N6)-dimethylallyltransferase MiaA [Ilumatobacteraceae bacterium]